MTTREKLRQLATALIDQNLAGRWRWAGNSKHGNYSLCTDGNGQQFLMRFTRKGMNTAQPTFRVSHLGWFGMEQASDIPIYEVCRDATSQHDSRVYRHDVVGFRSPVADYLAAVDAETVISLLDQIDHLEAALAAEREGATP
ncbi:hypothetical protein [Kineococcus radiotolerans]|uniref:Uncharacterized protein n=1 Tax=Kineococcus radiotolerans (strain ATCC BAA-149 / DSM 14245 / SRS30216) TaxID=266940 RepID=A6W8W1_KINRD|nr:hypothetical protein [Kineococcus radiotolerans]ABS03250.1 hypothetical protein Krad_1764 [Kineococcus radiotolerans SRS30216 = ATCC BAA-149]